MLTFYISYLKPVIEKKLILFINTWDAIVSKQIYKMKLKLTLNIRDENTSTEIKKQN